MKALDNMVHCILVLSKVCLCVSLGTPELLYERNDSVNEEEKRTVRKADKRRIKK